MSEGKLYWIQDAYTISDHFPYSNPHGIGFGNGLNYIRNSVKAVVDMYDGTVSFYVMDPDDPVLAVYRRAFPDVFKDLKELSPDLKLHLRYPQDLFGIQAAQYESFHMTDPQVFYNREDLWVPPQEKYDGKLAPMEPYYILMKLPGSDQLEYLMMSPFTPQNRDNMIAWLAAQVRFSRVRKNAVLRASQREADLRAKSDFSNDRSEHDDFAATDPLGPKRFRSHSGETGRDSDREFLPLRSPAVSQSRRHEFSPTQARHRGNRKQGRDGAYARRSTERPVQFAGSPAAGHGGANTSTELDQARIQLAEVQKAIDSLRRLLNEPARSTPASAAPQK